MQDIIYKLFLSSKGLIFIYVLRLSKLNHIVNNIHALLFIELNTRITLLLTLKLSKKSISLIRKEASTFFLKKLLLQMTFPLLKLIQLL